MLGSLDVDGDVEIEGTDDSEGADDTVGNVETLGKEDKGSLASLLRWILSHLIFSVYTMLPSCLLSWMQISPSSKLSVSTE